METQKQKIREIKREHKTDNKKVARKKEGARRVDKKKKRRRRRMINIRRITRIRGVV